MGLCPYPWDWLDLCELLREEMVRAEGVQWQLGAGLGNLGGFSKALGWSLREQLMALVGVPAQAGMGVLVLVGGVAAKEEKKRQRRGRKGGL